MGVRSMSGFILLAFLPFAGCTSTDVNDIVDVLLEAEHEPPAPDPSAGEASYGTPADAPAAVIAQKGTRFIAGAWALDGRVDGKADGAPSSHAMDAEAIPGFSLEVQFLSREEGKDTWSSVGFLLEHFRDAEDKTVAGGKARTEGALSGAYLVGGIAGDPEGHGKGVPNDFGWRVDLLAGLRRGFVEVEVPGPGGVYRGSRTWGEGVLGLRAEWSPIRRVHLFVRADAGGELGTGGSAEEDTGGGDTAIDAFSRQFVAGIRVRPVEHLSLLFGWRYVYLDGNEFLNGGEDEIGLARATWTGPWAGLEFDF